MADYYRLRSGPELATRWRVAVVESALSRHLMPDRGSLCRFIAHSLNDIRRLPIQGFPQHALFYRTLSQARTVHIVDILHGARDIEKLLSSRRP